MILNCHTFITHIHSCRREPKEGERAVDGASQEPPAQLRSASAKQQWQGHWRGQHTPLEKRQRCEQRCWADGQSQDRFRSEPEHRPKAQSPRRGDRRQQ
jgi:hypothetical protein